MLTRFLIIGSTDWILCPIRFLFLPMIYKFINIRLHNKFPPTFQIYGLLHLQIISFFIFFFGGFVFLIEIGNVVAFDCRRIVFYVINFIFFYRFFNNMCCHIFQLFSGKLIWFLKGTEYLQCTNIINKTVVFYLSYNQVTINVKKRILHY